jgi:hypothetical protein
VPRIADLVLPEEKLIRAEFINSVVYFYAFQGDFNFHSHMRMNFCFVAFKVFLLTCEPFCFFGIKTDSFMLVIFFNLFVIDDNNEKYASGFELTPNWSMARYGASVRT